jgi:hypothetical protein
VTAVLAQPRRGIAALPGKQVEAGLAGGSDVKTFVPMKVREGSGTCADPSAESLILISLRRITYETRARLVPCRAAALDSMAESSPMDEPIAALS